jgi:hypothetical protein
MAIARTCNCGRRITGGGPRCERCGGGAGRKQSCSVCGRRCRGPYCPEHTFIAQERTETERLQMQPWRVGYRDPGYHRERQAAIRRANGACEKCGRTDAPLQSDHIISLSTARSIEEVHALNHRDNLQMLCTGPGSCHERKTLNRG